jgi:uncharacterized protein with NRDE domain
MAAHFWEEDPNLLAGKDLEAGGTWMGITKTGHFAALTNYRDPKNINNDRKSRGELPLKFLQGELSTEQYLNKVESEAENYNGFNLLVWDGKSMMHYNNHTQRKTIITPGIYGLSNATLDSPWPKVIKLKLKFVETLQSDFQIEDLFTLLGDKALAADTDLPNTGIAQGWEKSLSAICIRTEKYGTVGSTVITLNHQNEVNFIELNHELPNRTKSYHHFNFQLAL